MTCLYFLIIFYLSIDIQGWIIIAGFLFIIGGLLALFPKTLPECAFRKMLSQEKEEETDLKNKNQVSFLGQIDLFNFK